jgi:hypothetical protein
VIALRDVEPAQVQTVIGVQVRQHDRVDLIESDVTLEGSERTVAQVEEEMEAVVLDEIAGGG